MSTPYIGFSNENLDKQPPAKEGDELLCWVCGERHLLEAGRNVDTGQKTDVLLFYKCRGKPFLGAVAGRWVVNVKPDVSSRNQGEEHENQD